MVDSPSWAETAEEGLEFDAICWKKIDLELNFLKNGDRQTKTWTDVLGHFFVLA